MIEEQYKAISLII